MKISYKDSADWDAAGKLISTITEQAATGARLHVVLTKLVELVKSIKITAGILWPNIEGGISDTSHADIVLLNLPPLSSEILDWSENRFPVVINDLFFDTMSMLNKLQIPAPTTPAKIATEATVTSPRDVSVTSPTRAIMLSPRDIDITSPIQSPAKRGMSIRGQVQEKTDSSSGKKTVARVSPFGKIGFPVVCYSLDKSGQKTKCAFLADEHLKNDAGAINIYAYSLETAKAQGFQSAATAATKEETHEERIVFLLDRLKDYAVFLQKSANQDPFFQLLKALFARIFDIGYAQIEALKKINTFGSMFTFIYSASAISAADLQMISLVLNNGVFINFLKALQRLKESPYIHCTHGVFLKKGVVAQTEEDELLISQLTAIRPGENPFKFLAQHFLLTEQANAGLGEGSLEGITRTIYRYQGNIARISSQFDQGSCNLLQMLESQQELDNILSAIPRIRRSGRRFLQYILPRAKADFEVLTAGSDNSQSNLLGCYLEKELAKLNDVSPQSAEGYVELKNNVREQLKLFAASSDTKSFEERLRDCMRGFHGNTAAIEALIRELEEQAERLKQRAQIDIAENDIILQNLEQELEQRSEAIKVLQYKVNGEEVELVSEEAREKLINDLTIALSHNTHLLTLVQSKAIDVQTLQQIYRQQEQRQGELQALSARYEILSALALAKLNLQREIAQFARDIQKKIEEAARLKAPKFIRQPLAELSDAVALLSRKIINQDELGPITTELNERRGELITLSNSLSLLEPLQNQMRDFRAEVKDVLSNAKTKNNCPDYILQTLQQFQEKYKNIEFLLNQSEDLEEADAKLAGDQKILADLNEALTALEDNDHQVKTFQQTIRKLKSFAEILGEDAAEYIIELNSHMQLFDDYAKSVKAAKDLPEIKQSLDLFNALPRKLNEIEVQLKFLQSKQTEYKLQIPALQGRLSELETKILQLISIANLFPDSDMVALLGELLAAVKIAGEELSSPSITFIKFIEILEGVNGIEQTLADVINNIDTQKESLKRNYEEILKQGQLLPSDLAASYEENKGKFTGKRLQRFNERYQELLNAIETEVTQPAATMQTELSQENWFDQHAIIKQHAEVLRQNIASQQQALAQFKREFILELTAQEETERPEEERLERLRLKKDELLTNAPALIAAIRELIDQVKPDNHFEACVQYLQRFAAIRNSYGDKFARVQDAAWLRNRAVEFRKFYTSKVIAVLKEPDLSYVANQVLTPLLQELRNQQLAFNQLFSSLRNRTVQIDSLQLSLASDSLLLTFDNANDLLMTHEMLQYRAACQRITVQQQMLQDINADTPLDDFQPLLTPAEIQEQITSATAELQAIVAKLNQLHLQTVPPETHTHYAYLQSFSRSIQVKIEDLSQLNLLLQRRLRQATTELSMKSVLDRFAHQIQDYSLLTPDVLQKILHEAGPLMASDSDYPIFMTQWLQACQTKLRASFSDENALQALYQLVGCLNRHVIPDAMLPRVKFFLFELAEMFRLFAFSRHPVMTVGAQQGAPEVPSAIQQLFAQAILLYQFMANFSANETNIDQVTKMLKRHVLWCMYAALLWMMPDQTLLQRVAPYHQVIEGPELLANLCQEFVRQKEEQHNLNKLAAEINPTVVEKIDQKLSAATRELQEATQALDALSADDLGARAAALEQVAQARRKQMELSFQSQRLERRRRQSTNPLELEDVQILVGTQVASSAENAASADVAHAADVSDDEAQVIPVVKQQGPRFFAIDVTHSKKLVKCIVSQHSAAFTKASQYFMQAWCLLYRHSVDTNYSHMANQYLAMKPKVQQGISVYLVFSLLLDLEKTKIQPKKIPSLRTHETVLLSLKKY